MKIREGIGGYLEVPLTYAKGKSKPMKIHRLVARAFIPIPDEYKDVPIGELDVHHIDFNKANNHSANLMWLSKEKHIEFHSNSEITKERRSEAAKGERNPMYGKRHSEDAKQRISKANKGKKMPVSFKEELSKRMKKRERPDNWGKDPKTVMQYTLGGELVANHKSMREAERQTKINRCRISKCCNGVTNEAGGYRWRYAD